MTKFQAAKEYDNCIARFTKLNEEEDKNCTTYEQVLANREMQQVERRAIHSRIEFLRRFL